MVLISFGAFMQLKQNSAYSRPFSFASVSITVLTVQISKAGAAFADLAGSVQPTQISGSFYFVPLAAADVDTLGGLQFKFTDSVLGIVVPDEDSADQVLSALPGDPVFLADVQAITSFAISGAFVVSGGVRFTNAAGNALLISADAGHAGVIVNGGVPGVDIRFGVAVTNTVASALSLATGGGFPGVEIVGSNGASGVDVIAGSTGPGLRIIGGSASGHGVAISTNDGDGILTTVGGAGKVGIKSDLDALTSAALTSIFNAVCHAANSVEAAGGGNPAVDLIGALRVILAAVAGNSNNVGPATGYKNPPGTKTRITGTGTAGVRTGAVIDVS